MSRTVALEARLWTPAQVAERYQLSERTLANWRSLGLGPPYIKAGRSVLYRETELARWEQTRSQAG
jgi:DNA-binding transcriptional MerR regulator